MPQRQVDNYDIIARSHRPVPPLSKAGQEGAANLFDIFLYVSEGPRHRKLAEISFWSGSPDSWPDDSYTSAGGDRYLRVNASVDAYAGVVDVLRNETNRYFQWRDPEEGRANVSIRSAVEPTGEGDTSP